MTVPSVSLRRPSCIHNIGKQARDLKRRLICLGRARFGESEMVEERFGRPGESGGVGGAGGGGSPRWLPRRRRLAVELSDEVIDELLAGARSPGESTGPGGLLQRELE